MSDLKQTRASFFIVIGAVSLVHEVFHFHLTCCTMSSIEGQQSANNSVIPVPWTRCFVCAIEQRFLVNVIVSVATCHRGGACEWAMHLHMHIKIVSIPREAWKLKILSSRLLVSDSIAHQKEWILAEICSWIISWLQRVIHTVHGSVSIKKEMNTPKEFHLGSFLQKPGMRTYFFRSVSVLPSSINY